MTDLRDFATPHVRTQGLLGDPVTHLGGFLFDATGQICGRPLRALGSPGLIPNGDLPEVVRVDRDALGQLVAAVEV